MYTYRCSTILTVYLLSRTEWNIPINNLHLIDKKNNFRSHHEIKFYGSIPINLYTISKLPQIKSSLTTVVYLHFPAENRSYESTTNNTHKFVIRSKSKHLIPRGYKSKIWYSCSSIPHQQSDSSYLNEKLWIFGRPFILIIYGRPTRTLISI